MELAKAYDPKQAEEHHYKRWEESGFFAPEINQDPAAELAGPWTEHEPISLAVKGSGVAAPGVTYEDGVFHMFIQTEFMKSGGSAKCLTLALD